MIRSLGALLAGVLVLAPPVRAQAPPSSAARPRPSYRYHLTGSLSLVRRQDEPWIAIHEALFPLGWDYYYPTYPCFVDCRELASQVAEGHPLAGTVALRVAVRGILQARAFAGTAPFGTYPGQYAGIAMRVTPSARVAGVQAGVSWRRLWITAGPVVTMGRVVEQGGPARREHTKTTAGLSLGAGLAFPARGRWYGEVALERRLAGAIRLDSLPVAGAPTIPPMRLRMSHTMLALGIGRRW